MNFSMVVQLSSSMTSRAIPPETRSTRHSMRLGTRCGLAVGVIQLMVSSSGVFYDGEAPTQPGFEVEPHLRHFSFSAELEPELDFLLRRLPHHLPLFDASMSDSR